MRTINPPHVGAARRVQPRHGGLRQAFRWYQRLTQSPRITPGSRRLNEVAALPILWEALKETEHAPILTLLNERRAVSTREIVEAFDGHFSAARQQDMADALWRLIELVEIYQAPIVDRVPDPLPGGGSQYRYRLTPLGRAMMRLAWNHGGWRSA